jgi:multiple antibiotic resistance protein
MGATVRTILDCTVACIALINPVSKLFLLSTLSERVSEAEIKRIAVKSSVIATVILLLFLFVGNVVLTEMFRIQIYAFKIAGGLVLVFRGFEALNKGLFFEFKDNQQLEEMSVVPLASPMIAGPATITAAVSFPATYGMLLTSISLLLAIGVNLGVMLVAKYINGFFDKHHIMGALARITGLIVATIGVQMMLDGFRDYLISTAIVARVSR